jgi:hypothetical protein
VLNIEDIRTYYGQRKRFLAQNPFVARTLIDGFERVLAGLLNVESVAGHLLSHYRPLTIVSSIGAVASKQFPAALEETWAALQQVPNANEKYYNVFGNLLTHTRRVLAGTQAGDPLGYLVDVDPMSDSSLLQGKLETMVGYASLSAIQWNNTSVPFDHTSADNIARLTAVNTQLAIWKINNEYNLYCTQRLYPLLYTLGIGRIAFPSLSITPLATRVLANKRPIAASHAGPDALADAIRNIDLTDFKVCKDLPAARVDFGIALLLDQQYHVEPQTPWWNMTFLSATEGTMVAFADFDSVKREYKHRISPELLVRLRPAVAPWTGKVTNTSYRRILVVPINTTATPDDPNIGSEHWILAIFLLVPPVSGTVRTTRLYVFDSMAPGNGTILGADGRDAINRLKGNLKQTRDFGIIKEVGFELPQGQKSRECGGRVLAALYYFLNRLDSFVSNNARDGTDVLPWESYLDNGLCKQTPKEMDDLLILNSGTNFPDTLRRYTGVPEISTFLDLLAGAESNPEFDAGIDDIGNGYMNFNLFKDYWSTFNEIELEKLVNADRFLVQWTTMMSLWRTNATSRQDLITFLGSRSARTMLSFFKNHQSMLHINGIGPVYGLFFADLLNTYTDNAWTASDYRHLFDKVDINHVSDSAWFDENDFYGVTKDPLPPIYTEKSVSFDKLVSFIDASQQLWTWIVPLNENMMLVYRRFRDPELQKRLVALPVPVKRPDPPTISNLLEQDYVAYIESVFEFLHRPVRDADVTNETAFMLANKLPPQDEDAYINRIVRFFLYERVRAFAIAKVAAVLDPTNIRAIVHLLDIIDTNSVNPVVVLDGGTRKKLNAMLNLIPREDPRFASGQPVDPNFFRRIVSRNLDSKDTPLDAIEKAIQERLNAWHKEYDATKPRIVNARDLLQRKTISTLDEILRAEHLVSSKELEDFSANVAPEVKQFLADASLEPTPQERVSLHKWANTLTKQNLTWQDKFYQSIVVETQAEAQQLLDDVAQWRQKAATIYLYADKLQQLQKKFAVPADLLKDLVANYNRHKNQWTPLYNDTLSAADDVRKVAHANIPIKEDPGMYYKAEPTVFGPWLLVTDHEAVIAKVEHDIRAELIKNANVTDALQKYVDARDALMRRVYTDFDVAGYRVLANTDATYRQPNIDEILDLYVPSGKSPDDLAGVLYRTVADAIEQELRVTWKVAEYRKRKVKPVDLYSDLFPRGGPTYRLKPDPMRLLDIHGQKDDILEKEETRLRAAAIPLRRQLNDIKEELAHRLKVVDARRNDIMRAIRTRLDVLKQWENVTTAIRRELDGRKAVRYEVHTLTPPNVDDYLNRAEEAFKKIPHEPVSYGLIPRGITVKEWRENPEWRIAAESRQLQQRREYAEFVAFTNARRDYMRDSRREALGIHYKGTRPPLY